MIFNGSGSDDLSCFCMEYLLCSTEILLIYLWNVFPEFRAINGEYILSISRGIVNVVYEDIPFRLIFVEVRPKMPLISILKQIRCNWSIICVHRNSNYLLIRHDFKLHICVFHGEVKASHNSSASPDFMRVMMFVAKNPALSKVQKYVFDPLLKQQVTKFLL